MKDQTVKDQKVVVLDDYRPRTTEQMLCLFCGASHLMRHLVHRRQHYFECPGCDETASVPEWSVRVR